MLVTESKLRQIVKEEYRNMMKESGLRVSGPGGKEFIPLKAPSEDSIERAKNIANTYLSIYSRDGKDKAKEYLNGQKNELGDKARDIFSLASQFVGGKAYFGSAEQELIASYLK